MVRQRIDDAREALTRAAASVRLRASDALDDWAFARLFVPDGPTFEQAVAKVLEEGCDVETEAAYAFPDPYGEPYFTVLNCTGDHSELDGNYEHAADAARAFVAIEKEASE